MMLENIITLTSNEGHSQIT